MKRSVEKLKDKKLVMIRLNTTMFERLKAVADSSARKPTDVIKEALFSWLEANSIELPKTKEK